MASLNEKSLRLFVLLSSLIWLGVGAIWFFSSSENLFFWVHTHHTKAWDSFFMNLTHLGDFVTIGPILILLLLTKYRSWHFFYLFALTQLFPVLVIQIIKFWLNAPRPLLVYGNLPWFHKIEGLELHSHLSFPSGHTAGAFAFFSILSLFVPQRFPFLTIVLFALAIGVAYSRMYLGQHHFEDVLVGSLLGTLGSILAFRFWKRLDKKKKSSQI